MTKQQIARHLSQLIQLDYDAARAYRQTIEQVDLAEIRDQMTIFENDHSRHIENLSQIIRRLGEEPPSLSPDLKGVLIEGFTAVRSMTGIEGILKAMEGNETLTNNSYREVVELHLPPDIKAQVELNFRDERRHVQYIEQKLTEKVWQAR